MSLNPNLFASVINQLRHGGAQESLSEALSECVETARLRGKSAKLVLTLTVKPHGDGQYELRDDVTTKLPKPERGLTLMFGTPEGNLTRHDPRQQALDLKGVPDDRPAELKKLA